MPRIGAQVRNRGGHIQAAAASSVRRSRSTTGSQVHRRPNARYRSRPARWARRALPRHDGRRTDVCVSSQGVSCLQQVVPEPAGRRRYGQPGRGRLRCGRRPPPEHGGQQISQPAHSQFTGQRSDATESDIRAGLRRALSRRRRVWYGWTFSSACTTALRARLGMPFLFRRSATVSITPAVPR